MLIQIPVFFALFVILRSAIELRFASFLWIHDLSAPERLNPVWFHHSDNWGCAQYPPHYHGRQPGLAAGLDADKRSESAENDALFHAGHDARHVL